MSKKRLILAIPICYCTILPFLEQCDQQQWHPNASLKEFYTVAKLLIWMMAILENGARFGGILGI